MPRRSAWAGGLVLVIAGLTFATVSEVPPPASEQVTTEESANLALRPPTTVLTAPTAPPDASTPDGSTPDGSTPTPDTTPAIESRSVMTIGDSVAFVAAFASTPESLATAGITSLDGRGFIGCGVLARAGWRTIGEGDTTLEWADDCVLQPQAEALGLTGRPDWVISFVGGWEGTGFVAPDGTRHAAMSDAVGDAILVELVASGERAEAAGSRIAWVTWVCPGKDSDRDYPADYPGGSTRSCGRLQRRCRARSSWNPPNGRASAPTRTARRPRRRTWPGTTSTTRRTRAWLWQVWVGPALAAAGRDAAS